MAEREILLAASGAIERVPAFSRLGELERRLSASLRGKQQMVRLVLVNLLARGHLLIEDVPGVGKTTIAHALAQAVAGRFGRLQFTSDMLPSDIIGVTIYNSRTEEFEFKPGAVFTNFLLADEINRATPKTQGALLEAMNEGQVTVDGHSYPLEQPFLVIATQNPIEHHGTYPLPESQLDRFLMRLRIGYPDRESERQIVRQAPSEELRLSPVLTAHDVVELQRAVTKVSVDSALVDYMLAIVDRTRAHENLTLGVSPRGAQALYRASQAMAALDGRDFVLPDDIKQLAVPVFAHRIVMASRFGLENRSSLETSELVIADILTEIEVPL